MSLQKQIIKDKKKNQNFKGPEHLLSSLNSDKSSECSLPLKLCLKVVIFLNFHDEYDMKFISTHYGHFMSMTHRSGTEGPQGK